jgi:VWFA-related protein
MKGCLALMVTAVSLLPALRAAAPAQRVNFSTGVQHVRVDVLVTENTRPVLGLQRDDFEVLDNGITQHVEFASFDQVPLNVILVLDLSASVAGERLAHLRQAVGSVLDRLRPGDQTALITFNQALSLDVPLTGDFGRVRAALTGGRLGRRTSLVDASFAGLLLSESEAGRALQIVFTDGVDVSSWLTPEAVLESAKQSDAVVYAVSVGGKPRFLRDLSVLTGGTLFEVDSTLDLSRILFGILDEFRHRYLVSYTPAGVPTDGWHKLDVRVRRRKVSITARPGYWATAGVPADLRLR